MDNLTGQAPNAIAVPQIVEMTTQEIKETIEASSPNWMTLQQMGMELANRCMALELPVAA
jgi:hypothetical protein